MMFSHMNLRPQKGCLQKAWFFHISGSPKGVRPSTAKKCNILIGLSSQKGRFWRGSKFMENGPRNLQFRKRRNMVSFEHLSFVRFVIIRKQFNRLADVNGAGQPSSSSSSSSYDHHQHDRHHQIISIFIIVVIIIDAK